MNQQNSTIRRYSETDLKDIVAIFSHCGMFNNLTFSEKEDILSRCNQIIDLCLVDDRGQGPVGTLSLVRRSKQEAWAFNLAFKKFPVSGKRTHTIWDTFYKKSMQMGYEWLSGMYRVTNKPFLETYYAELGWIHNYHEFIINPLPLCFRLWEDIGNVGTIFPQYLLEAKQCTVFNRQSEIIIDWEHSTATINHDEQYISHQFYHHVKSNTGWKNLRLGCISQFNPETGQISFDNKLLTLFPPWWTKQAANNIKLPSMDKWKWDEYNFSNNEAALVQHDLCCGINYLYIKANNNNSIRLKYTSKQNNKYLRVMFESCAKPIIENQEIYISNLMIKILSLGVEAEYAQWGHNWRIYIYASCDEFCLDISIKEKE